MARKQALQQLSSAEEAALRNFVSEDSDLRNALRAVWGEEAEYWLMQTKEAALGGFNGLAAMNASRADTYMRIEQTLMEFLKG